MATVTTIPGLKTIDPIQGLVDYVNDIKPYHTKIFEVSVEYVYTDYLNVTIVDINTPEIDMAQQDDLDVTFYETTLTEMLDFFVTAPTPFTDAIVTTDATNWIVYLAGDQTSDISIGDLFIITNSSSGNDGNYDVVSVGYNVGTAQTVITLNTLSGTNGTDGDVTVFNTDTAYTFEIVIQSADATATTIVDPANAANTFTTQTFTVLGNATRAVQAGSVFVVDSGANEGLYYAIYVNFVPVFDVNGARDPSLDYTVIGIGTPAGSPGGVFSAITSSVPGGNIIPYNITGYDDRYDAPYDGMAGYKIISS